MGTYRLRNRKQLQRPNCRAHLYSAASWSSDHRPIRESWKPASAIPGPKERGEEQSSGPHHCAVLRKGLCLWLLVVSWLLGFGGGKAEAQTRGRSSASRVYVHTVGDRPPSVYAYMPPPVLRSHTPGDAPRTPASGPRSVFRLFRGCNQYRSALRGTL